MKLIIVSEFFYPYKTSTQKIMTELAEDFVEYGLDVEVLTTKNAYREKQQELKKHEIHKGIKIKRIFSTSGNRDNKIWRIINYLTFLTSLFGNLLFKRDYDKILFVSNPPLAPFIGYIVKKLRGKEYIYLVHDVYPDVAEKLGVIKKDSLPYKVMNFVNNKIYKNAESIIALGSDMKQVIANKGVDENKIHIVTNWADKNNNYEIEVEKEFYEKYNLDNKFNVLYTGNISKVHAVDTVLDVAKKLKGDKDIRFTFLGDGNQKEYIKSLIEKEGYDNIQLYDYVFGEEYNKILNCADAFITTLQKGIEGLGVPSKTYTYMSVAKPLIAIMSENSEIGNMVRVNDLGIQASDDSDDKITDFIKSIKNDKELFQVKSSNVRNMFNEKYERKKVTDLFYSIIKK